MQGTAKCSTSNNMAKQSVKNTSIAISTQRNLTEIYKE